MRSSLPIRLAVLLLVALSVRLWFLPSLAVFPVTKGIDSRSNELGWDCVEYIRYAKNLALHGIFSHSAKTPYVPSAFRTPVYPVFLAPFWRFAATDQQFVLWITLAQIGLAGINAILTYWIALRLTGSSNLALAAGVIASLDLYSILLNFQVMSETLFLTLFLLAVSLFLRYLIQSHRSDLVWFSVLLAISGLCRPISLYSLPIFLCFVVLREPNFHKRLLSVAIASLAFFATLSPWVARNWRNLDMACVSTMDTYQNAVLASALSRARTGRQLADHHPSIWDELDILFTESLDELRKQTGKPVSFDSGITLMIAINYPELTSQLAAIVRNRTDPIIRDNRLLHLRQSMKALWLICFATENNLLCRMLEREAPDLGIRHVLEVVRSGHFKQAATLLGQVRWSQFLSAFNVLSKLWTYGYVWLLALFAFAGFCFVLVTRRRPQNHTGWFLVAILILFLLALPSYLALPNTAALAHELPRLRAAAVPFVAIFAVAGVEVMLQKIGRRRMTKDDVIGEQRADGEE